jgi:hypothetical protein
MEQSPSLEASSSSTTTKISIIVWNMNVFIYLVRTAGPIHLASLIGSPNNI